MVMEKQSASNSSRINESLAANESNNSNGHPLGCPCCFIIPRHVLLRFAKDRGLSKETRTAFAAAAKFEPEWRKLRLAKISHALAARALLPTGLTSKLAAQPPAVTVYNCGHGNN